uniref:Methylmalonyl-CoA mutase n=1 Tax=Candidatus Kentrum sp. FW TaxID=2126338 RepID=A0A450T468_9GAMM|nr:MAG: Methylmalonyl-CoA mutase [Candidatus Kentron sp. FW]
MNRNPDFTTLSYDATTFPGVGFDQWKAQVEKATGKTLEQLVSKTMEHIDVKSLYTKDDAGFDHLDHVAGIPPYFRGPYPSMYVTRPWTVRKSSRILHRLGKQRLLPAQPRRRSNGALHRLRLGHPPWL